MLGKTIVLLLVLNEVRGVCTVVYAGADLTQGKLPSITELVLLLLLTALGIVAHRLLKRTKR